MERPRGFTRSFSIKPARLLLLSSAISSSLLFCVYFSFWLLDATPPHRSPHYARIETVKHSPLAEIPIPGDAFVTVVSDPFWEVPDAGVLEKDEIFDGERISERSDFDLVGNSSNVVSKHMLFSAAVDSGGNPSALEDWSSADLTDEDENEDAAPVGLLGENSEFGDRVIEKEEFEADTVRSNISSFVEGKVSLVDKDKGFSCDVFDGRWVFDESYPLYASNSCPFVDEGFSCEANGRMDNDYMKWRWQPNGCSIPRFNPVKMLELIRGKRLVFVGDSINRNQWESMLCMLRTALSDPSRVYEARGQRITKNRGNYRFNFPDYDCSIEYYVSHHLVRESTARVGKRRVATLRLDTLDRSSSKWRGADILVFNSAHWWSHHKTKAGVNYYQEGNLVHPRLDVSTAFRKALSTWAMWVDQHFIPSKTQVFFRSSAPSHFSGGEWNSGGHCKESIRPLNETFVRVPEKNIILEEIVRKMKTPVTILNITNLSGLRIDGHPSIYGRTHVRGPPIGIQDCSHWCLPGVPDTWNELLYFHLLLRHKPTFTS